jgi:hypothetical protein
MKKWLIMGCIAALCASIQAGEEGKKKGEGQGKPMTKEQFVAQQQKMAEKKGAEFDQAAAEARFEKMDKNKDGVLTPDEKGKKKGQQKDAKKEEPAEAPEDAAEE